MKPDPMEDIKDSQEIRKQKEEQKRSTEELSKWEPGKGIVKDKDDKQNARD